MKMISQVTLIVIAALFWATPPLSAGVPPPPPCNLPPAPVAGQTVTWTAAGSPYEICQNIGIPPTATVIVQPGVQINFDPNMQVVVSGTLRLQGQAAQRVILNGPAVFPPIINVNGGVFDASFSDFTGQVRVENGANVTLADSVFQGNNAVLWAQELPSTPPFIRIERCTFNSSSAFITDAISVLTDNVFNGATCSVLRGFAGVTATNTFTNGNFSLNRQESVQPLYIDGVHASNSTTAGLVLSGGNYFVGPNTVLQNNPFPVALEGGLLPGSAIPLTGNTVNAIDVGNGGFAGRGHWSQLGLHYRLTQPTADLPGGDLTIDPGVIVEAADANAAMRFRSTRHGVLKGLPNAPIVFRGLGGQPWSGLLFHVNATTGCRLEYCTMENANFGAISTDNWLYVDSCRFSNNVVGANMNTFGAISFANTRFITNGSGVSFDLQGSPFLDSPFTPNSFEGNGAGINAFASGSSADARNCWWNHPSGPTTPRNPGGQGDSIVGPGEPGVQFAPFLISPPNFANTPPVVRMIEPGLTQLYASPDLQIPDFLLDQGTKYIVRWTAQDNDAIATQRIDFSPDGHYPNRYFTLVATIPASARSWEITLPNPGFAASNQPQFLRVVATDAAGQEGWDQAPVLVPSGNITGNITITTDLSGQTFTAGDSIPDMHWSGSVNFGTITPVVVLESDGAGVQGLNVGGQGVFFQKFPFVSTDRARLALQVRNNSNDVKWFFANGYFSIRHDSRFGFSPPSVTLNSPVGGEQFPGGSIVPILWTATASEGLRSFDVQASYDSGHTWHPIARGLPGTVTNYDWQLPSSSGIPDVRLRVVVTDVRFQNSSSTRGPLSITPGTATPTPTPTATPVATPTPATTATPTSTPGGTPTPTAAPTPTPTPSPITKAINVSTRMRVQTGDNVGIGGFIITGSTPKQVLVRGIGPSLTGSGVPNVLADPTLELHGAGAFTTIMNDNWRQTQEAEIQATGIPPTDDLESAIMATLDPGAYTAIIRGNGDTSGVALVEVYDLNQGVDSKLANLSTRALVSTGANIVISGFVLGGNSTDDRIVVRGIGPSLTRTGLPDVLADPVLELRDTNGTVLSSNNDWQDNAAQAAELTAAGLAPTNNLESGIATTLTPGLYTALLAGMNNGAGIGVVEVYDRGATP